jgi:hypothetical protein
MPSNQKVFTEVNAEEYAMFQMNARTKGWVPPYGHSGYLRGNLLADVSYNEKTEELSIRLREAEKGTTPAAFFKQIEDMLRAVDR